MRRWLCIAIAANLLLAMVALARLDGDHDSTQVVRAQRSHEVPFETTTSDAPVTTATTPLRKPVTHHSTHVTAPSVSVPVTTPPVVDDAKWSTVAPFAVNKLGLWLIDADKQEGRLLVGDLAPTSVAFSPDGTEAVFAAFDDPPYNGAKPIRLYVVNIASGERRQIAAGTPSPVNPSWSPDGQWIAFHANGQSQLMLVHPDGTGLHQLAVDDFGGHLAWAPTGHRLAAPFYNSNQVVIFDVDAGTENRWAFTHPYLVDWSPSGDKLVVSTGAAPTQLMDPATGALTTITADAFYPRWSPTSDVIAVRRDGMAGVIPASGGVFRPFGPGSPVDWSSDGQRLDYLDTTWTVQVADATSGLSRTIASVGHDTGWSLSPTAWVPKAQLVAVIVEPNAGAYMP